MIWLTGWNYRKQITISNTGSALIDYQVLVTVDTASLVSSGKLLSNCNDIRFTSSDSSATLNYWIESGCNTASTKIWIKIPYVASGTNAIHLYYGNSSATSSSNGTNTFIQYHGVATSQFFDPVVKNQPLIAEFRGRVTSTPNDIRWGVTNNNLVNPKDAATVNAYSPTNQRYFICYHGTTVVGGSGIYETPALTVGQYYRIKIVLSSTELHAYVDDNEISTGYVSNLLTANMGLFMLVGTGTSEQEWSFIRKYAFPEPTYTIYAEQIPSSMAAEGGIVTTSGSYRIHTFTSSGTFTVNKAMNVEYLVVAGGGGGGEGTGGGGGAGGMSTGANFPVASQGYTITVGVGGSGGPSMTNGGNSIFSTIISTGGGNGEGSPNYNGGSGGGGRWGQIGGTGISGQGNRGGNGNSYRSGGGGGAGSAGGDAGSTSGNGGSGLSSSISGSPVTYAGGGGGGADSFRGQAAGTGTDGGGNGGYAAWGTNATGIGCGGGGGANNGSYYGGNGSAGIVIIRYLLSEDPTQANITATNMTVTPTETPCRTGICTIDVSVTWTNTGETSGTFTPSITASSGTVTPVYSSEQLAASSLVTRSFTVSGTTPGICSICPYPN